jgi:hypothetical protein
VAARSHTTCASVCSERHVGDAAPHAEDVNALLATRSVHQWLKAGTGTHHNSSGSRASVTSVVAGSVSARTHAPDRDGDAQSRVPETETRRADSSVRDGAATGGLPRYHDVMRRMAHGAAAGEALYGYSVSGTAPAETERWCDGVSHGHGHGHGHSICHSHSHIFFWIRRASG